MSINSADMQRPGHWRYTALILAILAAGILLRCYFPYFRSMWGDEAHSFYKACSLSGGLSLQKIIIFTGKTIKESHMPLYFVLLSSWISGFGPAEMSIRGLSMLFGCLSLPVFYFFAREISDRKTALLATLVFSLSPIAVMFSQEIRMYSLALLLCLLSSWAFMRCVLKGASALRIISYFLFSLLFSLTHVYALLVIFSQGCYLIFRRFAGKQTAPSFPALISAQMALALLIFPLYFSMFIYNLGLISSSDFDMPYSVFPFPLRMLLFVFALCLGETVAPWNAILVLPAFMVFGYLIWKGSMHIREEQGPYLAISVLIPLIIAGLFLKGTMPKYLIVLLPFFIIFVSKGLAETKKWLLVLIVLVLIAVESASLYNYFNLRQYHNSNQIEPWRRVARLIENGYRPGDVIVYTNKGIIFNTLNYYMNITRLGHAAGTRSSGLLKYTMAGADSYDPGDSRYARIWHISHIADDRNISGSEQKASIKAMSKAHRLVKEESFVPYSETLVSKLPIKRHAEGSSRIMIRLFDKKGDVIKSSKKN